MRHSLLSVIGGALLAAVLSPLAAHNRLDAQPTLDLTRDAAIRRAQESSNPAQAARSQRLAARQRDRAFAGALLPQLALSGNVPVYNRSIIPVLQPDGSTIFRSQQQSEAALSP